MNRIRILPDLLVNKIAAGEVIERPASVVKELMENSVDAGASHVAVTIEDGGKQLIRIADDGIGMSPEDLRLAVTPHATSKLAVEDDLYRISTMGFRGEALASIGAISRMRIVSRTAEALEGAEIVVSAEHIESSAAAGCKAGTLIEVRDLFFNVPARRKFLRANQTEVGHINEQFARIAMAHRGLGFELTNNGRNTHRLRENADVRERIGELFGHDLADELMHIERDERGLHIEALVAPPAQSRSSANWQYVFLNGRFIRDRFVQHAVREAYRGLMEHNRYPVVFLFLTLDPSQVDVNVHPTKMEVRWQESNLIHSQVLAALRDKFLRSDLTPALRASGATFAGAAADEEAAEDLDADAARRQAANFLKSVAPNVPDRQALRQEYGDVFRSSEPRTGSYGGSGGGFGPAGERERERPSGPLDRSTLDALYGRASDQNIGELGDESSAERSVRPVNGYTSYGAAQGRALQVHNTYLVVETDDGMVIIDQHAMHERIMYEKLKNRIVQGPLESQRLLLPETFTATVRQQALLHEHAQLLTDLGIEAAPFGKDSIAIHAFPTVLRNVDSVSFVRDLLDLLEEKGEQTHREEVIHELLDMMSCKAAVKAGDPLTAEEIEALLADRELVDKSSNCPHGRPTALRLTINDLEKQFKRK